MPLSSRTLRPADTFTPRSISGLALWLDAADSSSLYTTDAGPVTAVSSPTEISGCVGWWDASDAASITESGGLVSQWNDKSGQGNHATASGTARPTLTASGLNGRSVVTFDGTANSMSVAANAAFNTNDLTYFIVLKQAALANKGVYTKLNATAGTNGFGLTVRSDPQVWLLQKNANLAQVLTASVNPVTQARIYSVTSSSSAAGYLDGLSSASASSTADHSLNQAVRIGSREGSEFFNGYIAEVIHFNTALSTADRARVEAYLAAKWGISGVHRPVSQELTAVSSPLELSGCAGWWDASRTDKMWDATSGGSLVASGGLVRRLDDLSGNGKHLVQATSAFAPSRQDGGLNGLSVLDLQGTKSVIAGAAGDWNFLHNTQGGTVFLVMQPSAVSDPQSFAYIAHTSLGGATNTVGINLFYDDRASGYGRNNYFSSAVVLGVSGQQAAVTELNNFFSAANSYSILSITNACGAATADRAFAYTNGLRQGTTNTATNAPSSSNSAQGFRIGSEGGNSISGLAEAIVFNTVLSATDRARVEKYLAAKWGISNVPDPTPPVGYWRDKSGNGRHATQSTAASRPTLGVLGSRNAASFAGSNSVTTPSYPAKATSTYIYVSRHDDTFDTIFQTGFTNQFHSHLIETTSKFRRHEAGANGVVLGSNIGVGSASLWCVDFSNAAASVRYNGATIGSTSTASNTPIADSSLTTTLGRLTPTELYAPLNGRIAEFMVYGGRNLSASEKTRLERYLAARWGITLAPQVANPDAQDWINRVYANGSTVSATTAAAVNTFCESINSVSGLREKFYRLNLFCGGAGSSDPTRLNAALVPLYRNYRMSAGRNEIQGEVFSGWSVSSATVTGGAASAPAAAPAGAPLASSFKEATTASAAPHTMSFQYTATGAECVVSAYIKPDGRDWVLFSVEDAGGNPFAYAYFNLAGMAAGSAFSGATNSTITDAGNGWARISFRCTPTAGTRFIRMFSSTANNANQTVGDSTKGYFVWGFQLEYGTTLTAYDSRPFGNATDTNASSLFVTGDYSETGASGGLQGSTASGKRLRTGLAQNTMPSGDLHLAAYEIAKSNAANDTSVGARSNAVASYSELLTGTSVTEYGFSNFQTTFSRAFDTAYTQPGAMMIGVASGATQTMYKNGSVTGFATAAQVPSFSSQFCVFSTENESASGADFTNARLGGYSIGPSMTPPQVAAYYTAMRAFQIALFRDRPSSDPIFASVTNEDAKLWIDSVYQAGGTVTAATAIAVNTFCNAIDIAGIRDRFYRLNLFCGGTSGTTAGLNAALVPLYRGPSFGGTQYGNTTDTNVSGLFISSDYSESAGLTANLSSTKHLDTGLQTSALPAGVIDSGHLSAWHGAISAADTDPYLIGANNGSVDRAALQVGVRVALATVESCRYGKAINVNASTGITGARPAAFLLGQRTSAINLELWKNNSVVGTTPTSTTGIAGIPYNFYVFSANNAGTRLGDQPGTTLRHYSIGDDMTPSQIGYFYNALSAFNASMGRV